ncbi:MAG: hypothetical protein K2Y28_12575 [Burkholderiaceae bacterium]|nr:hypothetical protein [Burkholderiaceae bacterium]
MMTETDAQKRNELREEWQILQTQFSRDDLVCLAIKLVCTLVFATLLIFSLHGLIGAFFVAVFWVMESMARTTQARIAERLLAIEASLALTTQDPSALSGAQHQAFYLHTAWSHSRLGVLGLLKEYASNAMRPTVAFPYVALAAFSFLLLALQDSPSFT